MKLSLITIIILFAVVNVFSQDLKTLNTKQIVGVWKVDSLEIGSFNLSPQYEAIVRDKMPEIIAMTEIKFLANKKYSKKGFDGTSEGNWSISKDGTQVLIKLDGSNDVSITKIIKLTDKKLVIAPDNENSANSKAYLYKVE